MTELICPNCNVAARKLDDICQQCGAYAEREVKGKDAALVGSLIVGSFVVGLLGFFLFFFVSFIIGIPLIVLAAVMFFVGDHQKNNRSQIVWYQDKDGRQYQVGEDPEVTERFK